jgi:uncharacterized protein (DUF58 family)
MRAMVRLLARIPAWVGSLPTTTMAGRVILSVTGLFAILAMASERNGPLLVLALLLALIVVSCIASARNLRRLEVARQIPPRVRAGEEFTVHLRVTNRRRHSPALAVRVRDALHPAAVGTAHLALPHLPAGATASLAFRARIRRRGAYRITNAMLVTRFPFGLLEHRVLRRHPSEILVTPREVVPSLDLDPGVRSRRRPGEIHGGRRVGTEEFLGIRDYRPGDNPRWIAWKATARQGRLMVRELDRPRRRRTVVLLDTDASALATWARSPAVERAVSLAAGVVRRLRRQRRPTVFAAFEPRLLLIRNVTRARSHATFLEALALLRPAVGRRPEELLAHLPRRDLRGADVVLVTPTPDAKRETLRGAVSSAGGRLHVVSAMPERFSRRQGPVKPRPSRGEAVS